MTILTDETIAAVVGMASKGPAAIARQGYDQVVKDGMEILAKRPQLRDAVEVAMFSAYSVLNMSRSTMQAVAQEVIPAMLREVGVAAAKIQAGEG